MKKRRASRRKYHFIYLTICLVTGRYYIGMHSTDNLNDGYLGSGTQLRYSVKKYGEKAHSRKILEFLPDRKSLRERERQIVNEEVIKKKNCMNIALGGCDRTSFHNKSWPSSAATKGNKSPNRWTKKNRLKESKRAKRDERQKRLSRWWKGKNRRPETKVKISISMKGKNHGTKNGNFGKKYVYNESLKCSKMISKNELADYLSSGWKIGRKIKW